MSHQKINAKVQNLRQKVLDVLNSTKLHDHQREAARKTFAALKHPVRAVITAAEMQTGKSGGALCCLQRLSLADADLCNRSKIKDTLYMVYHA